VGVELLLDAANQLERERRECRANGHIGRSRKGREDGGDGAEEESR
jgi:hypothetical protein